MLKVGQRVSRQKLEGISTKTLKGSSGRTQGGSPGNCAGQQIGPVRVNPPAPPLQGWFFPLPGGRAIEGPSPLQCEGSFFGVECVGELELGVLSFGDLFANAEV